MRIFFVSIVLTMSSVLCAAREPSSQSAPSAKLESAEAQLKAAVEYDHSFSGRTTEDDAKRIVDAYSLVVKYYPDAERQVTVAKLNMAHYFILSLNDDEAAERIYNDVLKKADRMTKDELQTAIGGIVRISGGRSWAEQKEMLLAVGAENPSIKRTLALHMASQAIARSIKQQESGLLDDAGSLLAEVVLDPKVNVRELLAAKKLLEMLPVLKLVHDHKDSIGRNDLLKQFLSPGGVSANSLVQSVRYSALIGQDDSSYDAVASAILVQRKRDVTEVQTVLERCLKNGKWDRSSETAVSIAGEIRAIELVPFLRRVLDIKGLEAKQRDLVVDSIAHIADEVKVRETDPQ